MYDVEFGGTREVVNFIEKLCFFYVKVIKLDRKALISMLKLSSRYTPRRTLVQANQSITGFSINFVMATDLDGFFFRLDRKTDLFSTGDGFFPQNITCLKQ